MKTVIALALAGTLGLSGAAFAQSENAEVSAAQQPETVAVEENLSLEQICAIQAGERGVSQAETAAFIKKCASGLTAGGGE